MKRCLYKCIAPLLCLSLLTGCSGGGIFTNYREVEELMIVQTMGFDLTPSKTAVSISGGGSSGEAKFTRMFTDAKSISGAEQKIQDYSAAEEIFYAHVNYIAMGRETAKEELAHCLDFIQRSPQMRMDTPLFVVSNGTAEELVLGSGNKEYDATNVLKSLERNLDTRGDCRIFSAKEVVANLNKNGSALICAVKCVKASNALEDAKDDLTALPDGYAVIKDKDMIGQISYEDALAVGLIQNEAGPCRITARTGSGNATVQLENCQCKIEPLMNGSELSGLKLDVKLSASLLEYDGRLDLKAAEANLQKQIEARLTNVLNMSKLTACDFLQLGGILEARHPFALAGMSKDFQTLLPDIYYIINVSADISRSFDADLEGSP